MLRMLLLSVLILAAALGTDSAIAQSITAPADTAYAGNIVLNVDLTDLSRRIFRVHEEIPVVPGAMTLLYPQWLPGNHSPTGPIEQMVGLTISANGQRIEWRRDPVEVFAFHVDVPAGASKLVLDFQFVSPLDRDEGRIVVTPEIIGLQWNTVLLYPAGHYSSQITLEPTIKLPSGWQFGTALETANAEAENTRFKPTSLEMLIDSPLFAGKYFKRFDLAPNATPPVHLDVVADAAKYLDAKPEILVTHLALVQQAYKLYGAQHYAHYDLLLALSDNFSGIGLEHGQSSENGTFREYLTDPKKFAGRDLLAHEYTHSWNGKFRRPADLWTPNFNVPMRDSLLWVYEGQTQYWGNVLAARAGMLTVEQARESLAQVAATFDHREGRVWRNLQDTTFQPILAYKRSMPWSNWQRMQDYYSEGELIWLDADTKIRELSGGKRSLDDFAHAFFGVENGRIAPLTYTFDDVVKTLDGVQKFDWATFLHTRLDGHGPGAPLDGIARAGWKLVYTDKPNLYGEDVQKLRKFADFSYSLGLNLSSKDGRISDVLWNGPAFNAGLAAGMKLIAVNGINFSSDELKDAITAAKGNAKPIDVLIENLDHYDTLHIDYHDGLRYPHLERVSGRKDRLSDILAARH